MQEEQKQPLQQDSQRSPAAPKPPEGEAKQEETIDRTDNIDKVYDLEGLLAGAGAGLIVGIIISFDAIFAMEIGMFIGLIIGTRFKKNKVGKDEDKKGGTTDKADAFSDAKSGNNNIVKH